MADDYIKNLDRNTASNMSIQPGKVINNDYHPVDSDMSATDDHWGTVRAVGINRLRTQMQQSDAKAWMDAAGKDSQRISKLAKGDSAVSGDSQ